MFMPRLPSRPADIYTVRIFEASTRPSLVRTLRKAVSSNGGTFVVDLVESRGFIFAMPHNAPDPLQSYQNARWLEEGCIHVTKTVLAKEEKKSKVHEKRYVDDRWDDEGGSSEEAEEVKNHPNLKMKWKWTAIRS